MSCILLCSRALLFITFTYKILNTFHLGGLTALIIHLFCYKHQLNRTQNDELYSNKNSYLILEIPAKKKNKVQFTSGTEEKTEKRSQMMKDSGN